MKVIARGRGTGKTRELLTEASKANGQVLSCNKRALQAKADNYELYDLPILDWNDLMYGSYDKKKPIYIDNAEYFLAQLFEEDFNLKLGGLDVNLED